VSTVTVRSRGPHLCARGVGIIASSAHACGLVGAACMAAVRELVKASIGSPDADYAEGVRHLTGRGRMAEAGAATEWRVIKGVPQVGRIERWCCSWSTGVTVGSAAAEAVGGRCRPHWSGSEGLFVAALEPRKGGDRLVAENRIPYTKASTRSRRTSALAPWLPSPPMHVQAAIDDVATAADRRPSLATSRCSSCQLRR
jgi:hypothetical protein